nr:NUDIX domain-containing protein [Clostridia bacterium]
MLNNVEVTNMVMIYDSKTDRVLVQNRRRSWKGIAFPGGHLEPGESIRDSAIREVREETGLDITDLEYCGMLNWYCRDDGKRT